MSVVTELASTTPWGQVLGLLGGLGTGVLTFFQKKQDRAHELAVKKAEFDFLVAKGNIDQATLAGELAKLREQGAGNAFTASIDADSKLPKSYKWIDAFRAFTRPGLTWYCAVLFTLLSLAVLRGWGASLFDHPLASYIFATSANLMEMTISWWFGSRQIDKMTTEWGNRMVNAKVSGSKS